MPIQQATCATCRHFQPDVINPVEGMGRCLHQARHGYWHAMVVHRCPDHEPKEPPADE